MKLPVWVWILLVGLYVISPFDLHPAFLDDLLALAGLAYLVWTRFRRPSGPGDAGRTGERGAGASRSDDEDSDDPHKVLGVRPGASPEALRRAYRARLAENHPDKVRHLSPELQARAHELTLRIQQAYQRLAKR